MSSKKGKPERAAGEKAAKGTGAAAAVRKRGSKPEDEELLALALEAKAQGFANLLAQWGSTEGRKGLPWQGQGAYGVWVSEVMLQQTQVEAVKGRYAAFMEKYPAPGALAAESAEGILAMWAGLGYYSRALRLLDGARIMAASGAPQTFEQWLEIPGVGHSTASAIMSLACGEKRAITDGNAKRVIGRVLGSGQNASENGWRQAALALMEETGCALHTQSIMDLGSGVCKPKNPACSACPLSGLCKSREAFEREGRAAVPAAGSGRPCAKKQDKKKEQQLWRPVGAYMEGQLHVLLEKRKRDDKIWNGLWVFAELPEEERAALAPELRPCAQGSFEHELSHRLFIVEWQAQEASEETAKRLAGPGRVWAKLSDLAECRAQVGVPSAVVKCAKMAWG